MIDEIGAGGFSVVYRARQSSMNRDVAIKVLNAGFTSDDERRTFERECHALGQLSHHPEHRHGVQRRVHRRRAPLHRDGAVPLELSGAARTEWPVGDRRGVRGGGPHLRRAADRARGRGAAPRPEAAQRLRVRVRRAGARRLRHLDDRRRAQSQSRSSGLSIAYAAPEVLEDGDASVASDVYSTGHHALPADRRAPPPSPARTSRRRCGASSRRRRPGSTEPGCRPGSTGCCRTCWRSRRPTDRRRCSSSASSCARCSAVPAWRRRRSRVSPAAARAASARSPGRRVDGFGSGLVGRTGGDRSVNTSGPSVVSGAGCGDAARSATPSRGPTPTPPSPGRWWLDRRPAAHRGRRRALDADRRRRSRRIVSAAVAVVAVVAVVVGVALFGGGGRRRRPCRRRRCRAPRCRRTTSSPCSARRPS